MPANVTTRPPRDGEQHGVDYYFVAPEEFQRMIDEGQLMEHAVVYGQGKGVPKDPIREALTQGRDVIKRTDIQGARTIKKLAPQAITIFVAPPSEGELENRMKTRGGDTPEQVRIRLDTAKAEMAAAPEFDYTVINDDLERCTAEVEAILKRERARSDRKPVTIA